jgi:putative heme iron utilization protein
MKGEHLPYASLVDLLPLSDGDVAMFLSALAEHRRYLEADPRGSVLVAPSIMKPNALALPRVTLIGRVEPVDNRESLAALYTTRHPEARMYVALPDFRFFRLRVEKVRYIAGFGEMGWIDGVDYRLARSPRGSADLGVQ